MSDGKGDCWSKDATHRNDAAHRHVQTTGRTGAEPGTSHIMCSPRSVVVYTHWEPPGLVPAAAPKSSIKRHPIAAPATCRDRASEIRDKATLIFRASGPRLRARSLYYRTFPSGRADREKRCPRALLPDRLRFREVCLGANGSLFVTLPPHKGPATSRGAALGARCVDKPGFPAFTDGEA